MLTEWFNIGTIIQAAIIDEYPEGYDRSYYLEVGSQFDKDYSNEVIQWPNSTDQPQKPPKN